MDLLWMILLVFLVCAEAQNVTEVKVKLGQNVTLNCSVIKIDVYWYVEIVSQVQGYICHTFSGYPALTEYFFSSSITKYSAWENSLLINNITADDCRLYFCGRRINDKIQFVDTFRLVSDVGPSPPNNVSKENNNDQQHDVMCHNNVVICSSYFLFVFLSLGLLCSLIWLKKKKNCTRQVTHPSPYTTGTLDSQQYAEIQFPPVRAPSPATSSECIYFKVQVPHSSNPGR